MLAAAVLGALALGAACGDGNADSSASATSTVTPAPTSKPGAQATDAPAEAPTTAGAVVLGEGQFSLPAAAAFEDEGFHLALSATNGLRADLEVAAGARLILELRDASRPEQTCGREHPTSGCATVDWSDFEGRPGVPEGGVFDNRLTIATSEGERAFFLSESGALVSAADLFSPG